MAELQLPLSQATGGDSTSSTIYDAEFPTVGENRLSRPKKAALAVLSALGLAALAGGGYWLANSDAPAPVTTISLSWLPVDAVPKNSKALTSAHRLGDHAAARTVDLGSAPQSGAYFVTLEIGSPPRPFRVHLDTGSSSLFIPASYEECATCDPHFDRAFDMGASSTASALSCSDEECGRCSAACGNPEGRSPDASTALFLGADDVCTATDDGQCRQCLEHDTCKYKGDGECDDGSQGGEQYCDLGTDSADCSPPGTCCESHCCAGGSDSCAFQAAYGDESGVSGKIYRDQISLGTGKTRLGTAAYMGVFDKVHMTASGDMFEEPDLDGIFGVAGGVLNDGRVPVLDEILEKNGMDNVFALCLGGVSGTTSAWDVGSVDPAKHTGTLQRVHFQHGAEAGFGSFTGSRISDFAYYNIAAPTKTTVGGRSLGLSPEDYSKGQTITIDSGTTYLMLATPVFNAAVKAIKAGVSAHATSKGYVLDDAQHNCFVADDESYNPNQDYPMLRFWVENTDGEKFALELAPQHYLGAATSPGVWCLGLADGGGDSIFGGMFMEAFYTVFDRSNYELGFAPVSARCGNHVQDSSGATIRGCDDESFAEYDSSVNVADPSACRTRSVQGCLDPNFEEYNPAATRDATPTLCCTCVSGGYCATEASEGCANQQPADGPNSCRYHDDGECDDGSQGGTQYCATGTDTDDCAATASAATGSDSCRYANDGECDDGSQGGTQYCETGTDATDCAATAAHFSRTRKTRQAAAPPSVSSATRAVIDAMRLPTPAEGHEEVIHESETLSGLEIPADVLAGLEDPTSEEYADALQLLQIYLAKQLGVAPSAINIDDIDIEELTAVAGGPGSAAVS